MGVTHPDSPDRPDIGEATAIASLLGLPGELILLLRHDDVNTARTVIEIFKRKGLDTTIVYKLSFDDLVRQLKANGLKEFERMKVISLRSRLYGLAPIAEGATPETPRANLAAFLASPEYQQAAHGTETPPENI